MGRLQKKKDPSKKAKRRDQDVQLSAQGDASSGVVARKPAQVVKKSPAGAKTKAAKQDQNIFDKSVQFIREVKIELKKVTWPSRKQTMGSTAVVLVLVLIISLFLGLVDVSLSSLIRVVLQ